MSSLINLYIIYGKIDLVMIALSKMKKKFDNSSDDNAIINRLFEKYLSLEKKLLFNVLFIKV